MIRVVMVSARSSSQEQLRAFEAGADDYVVKPFDPQDFRAIRLHFQLQEAMAAAAAIRSEIESRNLLLRQEAKRHTRDMIALQDIAVFTLAKVAESRDQQTGGHLARMRLLADPSRRARPRRTLCGTDRRAVPGRPLPLKPPARHRQGGHSRQHPAEARAAGGG